MKRNRIALFFLTCALALVGPLHPATANAAGCALSCGTQKVACLGAARATNLGCRASCRDGSAPADLGRCLRGCARTFRTGKRDCRVDHGSCAGQCTPGGTPSDPGTTPCPAECGKTLATCAQQATTTLRSCLGACEHGPGHHTCVDDCTSTLQGDQGACHTDFQSCHAGCGASPSGAFVD